MVKKNPEIVVLSDSVQPEPVGLGVTNKSENISLEGDLLSQAVALAQRSAQNAKISERAAAKKSQEAGIFAIAAKSSEKISTTNKVETNTLKDQTDIASKEAKWAEKKSKKILSEMTEKEKKSAANLDATGNLAKRMKLKEKETSDTLKWAKAAKADAERAARQAIEVARALGEPQQSHI